jgi:predicted RNA-binding protein YlqC (UPF0109 family)
MDNGGATDNNTNYSTDTSADTKDELQQEIRCLIENSQVGGIIGKGGANVKRVREDSGAFVSILKAEFRNVQERIMVIKGTAAEIAHATHLIAGLLVDAAFARDKKDDSSAARDPETTIAIRYLVHRTAVGAIIGKAGAVIQETQASTNARVQVSNEPLPQSTEKSVMLTGTPLAIRHAAHRILTQLRDNPLRTGTKVYPYVPGQPIFAQSPYGGLSSSTLTPYAARPQLPIYGQQASLLAPYGVPQATSTQKIAIPTVCVGCVIGKGGSVIRDLRVQSGTNISIADPEPTSPNERVVTLTGTPQGIQTAVFLIRQLVEQYQPLNY